MSRNHNPAEYEQGFLFQEFTTKSHKPVKKSKSSLPPIPTWEDIFNVFEYRSPVDPSIEYDLFNKVAHRMYNATGYGTSPKLHLDYHQNLTIKLEQMELVDVSSLINVAHANESFSISAQLDPNLSQKNALKTYIREVKSRILYYYCGVNDEIIDKYLKTITQKSELPFSNSIKLEIVFTSKAFQEMCEIQFDELKFRKKLNSKDSGVQPITQMFNFFTDRKSILIARKQMVLNLLANECLSMPNAINKTLLKYSHKQYFITPIANIGLVSNEILSFYKDYYNQLADLFSLKSYDEVIKLANESGFTSKSQMVETLFAYTPHIKMDYGQRTQVREITNTFIYDVLKFATNGFTKNISQQMQKKLPYQFFSDEDEWGDAIPSLRFLQANCASLMYVHHIQFDSEQREYLRSTLTSGKTQKDVIMQFEGLLNKFGLDELLPYFEEDGYYRKYMSQIAQKNKKK